MVEHDKTRALAKVEKELKELRNAVKFLLRETFKDKHHFAYDGMPAEEQTKRWEEDREREDIRVAELSQRVFDGEAFFP